MDQDTFDLIKYAIENKMQILFKYGDCYRDVCPHMLGETDKGMIVHGFQCGAGTSKGEIISPKDGEWRFFYLDKFDQSGVALKYGDWHPADLAKSETEYKPPKAVRTVFALVKR